MHLKCLAQIMIAIYHCRLTFQTFRASFEKSFETVFKCVYRLNSQKTVFDKPHFHVEGHNSLQVEPLFTDCYSVGSSDLVLLSLCRQIAVKQ